MVRVSARIWPLALGLLGACWHATTTAPSPFQVVRVSPDVAAGDEPLLLNDSITVYFSAPLDPISVTDVSVAITDADKHAVPGTLKSGSNWVSFSPEPPLRPDLEDGSFLAGETYRLVIYGYPRADGVRAADGRLLADTYPYELRMAAAGPYRSAHMSLPAPLRPPSTDIPFLLRGYEVPQQLPVDAPRLRLHFTLPVLPPSATADAFVVQLAARGSLWRIEPRNVRVVSSPRLDQYLGATIEIDLGSEPRIFGTDSTMALEVGDLLYVALVDGDHALRDLGGNAVLPAVHQCWSVVSGSSLSLLAWPAEEGGAGGDDPLWPGFESLWGLVRPRVRVEAGDGSLGLFRPQRDIVLRPGQSFDRGDGVMVQSLGSQFPFLAIDIPAHVRVRVEGRGTQLLACGGIRVAGVLELEGASAELPMGQHGIQHGIAARELLELAPAAVVAAGDILIEGAIVTGVELPPNQTALTLACAGRIHILGELPYNTILAVESPADRSRPANKILGARGQTFLRSTAFEYGVASGLDFAAKACTSWSRMPADRDGGFLHLSGAGPGIRVAWQTVPADPLDPERPDFRRERVSRPKAVQDGDWVPVEPGSYIRFTVEADLGGGAAPPQMEGLRLAGR
ncbi:MAG: Ig-like domain-containing protein [Planctomycetes bacterium]|nr:Ig-like domain-containing protein [Planctomycetota bacterium]